MSTPSTGRRADPHGLALHRAFDAQARATPERTAIVDATVRLTYAQLRERVDAVAAALRSRGVGPDRLVGVWQPRSAEMVVSVLGVLAAGGAFVPLDTAIPPDRIAEMVRQVCPHLIVVDSFERALPGPSGPPLVRAGDLTNLGAAAGYGPLPRCELELDHLAYVMFTSGTTNSAKPVAVSHRDLRIASAWLDSYDLRRRPLTLLQIASFGFDVWVADLARALLPGGTLVIADDELRWRPDRLADLIERTPVEGGEFTPSVLWVLVDYLASANRTLSQPRLVVLGGEPWTAGQYARLRAAMPNARIVNSYGSAEATIDSLIYDGRPPADPAATMPIGVPHRGVEAYVLDGRGRQVAVGEVGELHLGGDGVTRGYHGRPGLTAMAFRPHPVRAGDRVFATGDLVRRPARDVEYLGRVDHTAKVRGIRIDLAAVERALVATPGVRQAVATTRLGDGGNDLIVHLVLERPGPATAELRAAARAAAGTAVSQLIVHDSFPVTPNGKVDRARLAEAPLTAATGPAAADTTRGAVGDAWREVIGAPPAADDSDFFAAGGDSLAVTRFALAIHRRTGVRLQPEDIFANPTLPELERHVDRLGKTAVAAPPVEEPTAGPRRLTSIQEALWLHHQLHPDRSTYHVAHIVEVRGLLDPDRLTRAVNAVVSRHEQLRALVGLDADGPLWSFQAGFVLRPAVLECPDDATATALAREFIELPFDLAAAPPIRVCLLRLAPQLHHLVLVVHHIATDAESSRIILREIGEAYSRGGTDHLPPPPTQPPQPDRHRPGLRRKPDDAASGPTPLPLDRMETGSARGLGLRVSTDLPPSVCAAVRDIARCLRVTPFTVLLAAAFALLRRWTGEDTPCIGIPVSRRTDPEQARVVGCFVETVSVRSAVSESDSFTGLVQSVWQRIRRARRDGSPEPFRLWFNHLGTPESAPRLAGLATRTLPLPVVPALFDVNLYVTEPGPDEIRLELVVDRGLASARLAQELLDQYRQLLVEAVGSPEAAHASLSIRTPVAQAVLPDPVAELRGPNPPALARRLLAVARSNPDATAIRGAGEELTYRTCVRRIRGLRRDLTAAGVRSGTVVAVGGPRGVDLVLAALAAMAAGARVLPIDLEQPVRVLAAAMTRASAAHLLLAGAAVPPDLRLRSTAADVIASTGVGYIEVDGDRLEARPAAIAPVAPFDSAGYVTSTSGTVGAPAIVASGTDVLTHFLDWYVAEFRLGPADRFALLSGLSYEPFWRDLMSAPACGATLCVPQDDVRAAPVRLCRWLSDEAVSVVHLTPPVLRTLLDAGEATTECLTALRLLVTTGDRLTARDITRLRALAPAVTIVHGYGATETPQLVSVHRVEAAQGSPPIGAGAPGSQLLIVNRAGADCGIGEVGEIVVRSRHLADGYLVDGGLQGGRHAGTVTRDAFTGDTVPGVRRYHTGDLGRYRLDGTIDLVGRVDDQVKIRGVRLVPSEVDTALAGWNRLAASVTVARPSASGERELITYAVPVGRSVTASEVQEYLRPRLPSSRLPSHVVIIPRLPLDARGKVDRAALPRPGAAPLRGERVDAATALERQLVDVWRRVLGVGPIGVTDNFLNLGTSSLDLAAVQVALHAGGHPNISLLTLYHHPTIRRLGAHLEALRPRGSAPTGVAGDRPPDPGRLGSRRHASAGAGDERARRIAARQAFRRETNS